MQSSFVGSASVHHPRNQLALQRVSLQEGRKQLSEPSVCRFRVPLPLVQAVAILSPPSCLAVFVLCVHNLHVQLELDVSAAAVFVVQYVVVSRAFVVIVVWTGGSCLLHRVVVCFGQRWCTGLAGWHWLYLPGGMFKSNCLFGYSTLHDGGTTVAHGALFRSQRLAAVLHLA